ncbi:uncharacterized protein N7473_008933 [Penicillium subrubescens]|nr:uncharacterized protein N7473_008933 [Penicillium subrubescens]KAJ5886259.1 hypothetical protein N7473_008933 [Penicillium subrubescens]
MRFSPELDDGLDYRGLGVPTCVQYMLVDEACFHSSMATALFCLDNIMGRSENKLQALRHASRTVRLVNQKLSLKSAITDFTIAAVISMAQYEHHQNRFQQGSAHVQGLWQISQLRGGVSNLTGSPSGLGQKMLRIDLESSLQLGSPTAFTLKEAENGCRPLSGFPSMCLQSDDSILPLAFGQYPARALPANYRDLFVDVLFLASLLNNAILGNAPKMDAIELYQDIIFLGYRLVNLGPLGGLPRGISRLQNKVHLGLAAFLVTFLQGWDGRVAQNDLLAEMLISEARQAFNADLDGRETLLWLLFIGAAASRLWKYPVWVSAAKCTLHSLKVMSWQDAKVLLAAFPWVDAIHDTSGQALWQEANASG